MYYRLKICSMSTIVYGIDDMVVRRENEIIVENFNFSIIVMTAMRRFMLEIHI